MTKFLNFTNNSNLYKINKCDNFQCLEEKSVYYDIYPSFVQSRRNEKLTGNTTKKPVQTYVKVSHFRTIPLPNADEDSINNFKKMFAID